MKVLNLFGAPGAGKSTLAAGIFYNFKMKLQNVELVTEFAKELTWAERHNCLGDQLYVFAKQHQRLLWLEGKVDIAVTDSPLLLTIIYGRGSVYETIEFEEFVCRRFDAFDNVNFYIERTKPYFQIGRNQTEEQSDKKGEEIRQLLDGWSVPYQTVPGNEEGISYIMEQLRGETQGSAQDQGQS